MRAAGFGSQKKNKTTKNESSAWKCTNIDFVFISVETQRNESDINEKGSSSRGRSHAADKFPQFLFYRLLLSEEEWKREERTRLNWF